MSNRATTSALAAVLTVLAGCPGPGAGSGADAAPDGFVLLPGGACYASGATGGELQGRVPVVADTTRCGSRWVAAAAGAGVFTASGDSDGCRTEEQDMVLTRLGPEGQPLWSQHPFRMSRDPTHPYEQSAFLVPMSGGGILMAVRSTGGFTRPQSEGRAGTAIAAFASDGAERGTLMWPGDFVEAMTAGDGETAWVLSRGDAGGAANLMVRLIDAAAHVLATTAVASGPTTRMALDRTGAVALLSENESLVLSRFDDRGQLLWSDPFTKSDWPHLEALALDVKGNTHVLLGLRQNQRVTVAGVTVGADPWPDGHGNGDVAWLAFDQSGGVRWARTFNGAHSDQAMDVVPDAEGGMYLRMLHDDFDGISALEADETRLQFRYATLTSSLLHVAESGHVLWGRCLEANNQIGRVGGLVAGWDRRGVLVTYFNEVDQLAP